MSAVDLSRFRNDWYRPGRSRFTQAAWFFLGAPILRFPVFPFSWLRRGLLRLFGARVDEDSCACVLRLRVRDEIGVQHRHHQNITQGSRLIANVDMRWGTQLPICRKLQSSE